jgi:hypothetical protein
MAPPQSVKGVNRSRLAHNAAAVAAGARFAVDFLGPLDSDIGAARRQHHEEENGGV